MSRAAGEDAEAAVAVPATDELWQSPPAASPVDASQSVTRRGWSRVRRWLHDAFRYSGPGWLFSIVFIDPGNLFADIQSGSGYRYAQLWVVWWSQWAGYFIGWLCVRFVFHGDGVTDLSRAQRNFYRRPPWSRYVVWALLELIVMGTDISMVIGFAFGVNILTGLPVWAGALLSGLSTVMVLATQLLGFHVLELIVTVLLLALGILLLVALIKSGADVGALFFGWVVPTFSSGNAVYDAMDMIGTVVGPHNPYLQTGVLLAHYAALGVRAEMLRKRESRTTADTVDTGGGECSPAETSERTACHGKQDSNTIVDVHGAGDAGSADHQHSPPELGTTATEDAIQTMAPPAHGVLEVENDSRQAGMRHATKRRIRTRGEAHGAHLHVGDARAGVLRVSHQLVDDRDHRRAYLPAERREEERDRSVQLLRLYPVSRRMRNVVAGAVGGRPGSLCSRQPQRKLRHVRIYRHAATTVAASVYHTRARHSTGVDHLRDDREQADGEQCDRRGERLSDVHAAAGARAADARRTSAAPAALVATHHRLVHRGARRRFEHVHALCIQRWHARPVRVHFAGERVDNTGQHPRGCGDHRLLRGASLALFCVVARRSARCILLAGSARGACRRHLADWSATDERDRPTLAEP
eukprot:ctg_361.g126